MFRAECAAGSELAAGPGNPRRRRPRAGRPDHRVVRARPLRRHANGFSGWFPRTLAQAEALDRVLAESIARALGLPHFELPDDIACSPARRAAVELRRRRPDRSRRLESTQKTERSSSTTVRGGSRLRSRRPVGREVYSEGHSARGWAARLSSASPGPRSNRGPRGHFVTKSCLCRELTSGRHHADWTGCRDVPPLRGRRFALQGLRGFPARSVRAEPMVVHGSRVRTAR